MILSINITLASNGPPLPLPFSISFFLSLLPFPFPFPPPPSPHYTHLSKTLKTHSFTLCHHLSHLHDLGFPSFPIPCISHHHHNKWPHSISLSLSRFFFYSAMSQLHHPPHYQPVSNPVYCFHSAFILSSSLAQSFFLFQRLLVGFSPMSSPHSPNGRGHSKHPPKRV